MDDKAIAIVDYGAGNLTSVACAVRHLGREPFITNKPGDVLRAERVIFPGVGAAGASMENLARLELDDALREFHGSGRPILGICIGCQILFEWSKEDGGTPCLGLLEGTVEGFAFPPGSPWKVPHMGWNEVAFRGEHPVFASLRPGSQFYFVHGYYPLPGDESIIAGTAEHGGTRFAAAVARGNLAAVQFHTEKSGPPGLRILENFLHWEPGRS